MPENETQNTNNQNADENSEQQQSSEQASSLEATGFKWGDNAPSEWRGKPAEYAIQERQQMIAALQQIAAQQLANQQAAAQPQARLPDPELAITDTAKWQTEYTQALGGALQNYVQQVANPVLQSQAETAKRLVSGSPAYGDVFKKWGHEVEALVNSPQVPLHLRANPTTWEQASRIVRGEHTDEIAAEKAKHLAARASDTAVAGADADYRPSPAASSALEKIRNSTYGSYLMKDRGYRARDIEKMCDQRGITMEKFADECARSKIIHEKPGSWKTQVGKNVAEANRGR